MKPAIPRQSGVAVILAAGTGQRLQPLTADLPKALVPINGTPLLERTLRLLEQAGFGQVHIVVGHAAQAIRDFVAAGEWALDIGMIENPDYARANNNRSVLAAKDVLCRNDVLLIECDIVFNAAALAALLDAGEDSGAGNAMLVAPNTPWMDGAVVEAGHDGRIVRRLMPDRSAPDPAHLKTANLHRLTRQFSAEVLIPMIEELGGEGDGLYYDDVIGNAIAQRRAVFTAIRAPANSWYEVDHSADRKVAEDLFDATEAGGAALPARHGGYWRLPDFQDSSLLVNPYFPPPAFVGELLAAGDALLRGYPSGQRDQTILAERAVGVSADRLAVGNGASELVLALLAATGGRVAIAAPSFEEYFNRLEAGQLVLVEQDRPDRNCSVEELLAAARTAGASTIVHVNPQNPTGHLTPAEQLEQMIAQAGAEGMRVIVDESFIDFADPSQRVSLLQDSVLDCHPNLAVIKSISKSYGIPGVRLGVLAAAPHLVGDVRARLPIWNINSFAEHALEILPRYRVAYEQGLAASRAARDRLIGALAAVPFLTPWPSAANFVFCEVAPPWTARLLTSTLLRHHHILIKDCTGKLGIGAGEFIRIAVGTNQQADRLGRAMANLPETAQVLSG